MILSVEQFLSESDSLLLPFGLPTETVYGLAAPYDRADLVGQIFTLKNRPFFDPLIVHVKSAEQARGLVSEWSPVAETLSKAFWPGPLTLVLPKAHVVSDMISAGLKTVGLRCPRHPVALQILERLGPLAAPSANRFGHTSPTTAEHVRFEFADQSELKIVDGGPCEVGIESTVLQVRSGRLGFELSILRPGAVRREDIEKVLRPLGLAVHFVEAAGVAGPGQLKHHYMPEVPLILLRDQELTDELRAQILREILGLPDEHEGVKLRKPAQLRVGVELKLSSDAALAARELYARLRELAATAPDFIYFRLQALHSSENWRAICDRLDKAALLKLLE